MKVSYFLNLLLIITFGSLVTVSNSGCGQIGAISGGLKDTLPPALLAASPKLLSTDITDNKITLTFDEYVDELQEVQSNVLVSPYPKILS